MATDSTAVSYRTVAVGDTEVFYREAGAPDAPVLLLLHGFPTSSHMFRDLIPKLAHRYRLVAPDLPGFGLTRTPVGFAHSFDSIARVIDGFTQALSLARYALYVFDYGAPTGFRLAMWHPQRVTAIISQNGNAYEEGLSKEWEPWQRYWREPTPENREACRIALHPDVIRDFQYRNGADESRISPDGYTLDNHYLERPGAEAYRRDIPEAEVHLLDTGHFALETHATEIAALIDDFLTRKLA